MLSQHLAARYCLNKLARLHNIFTTSTTAFQYPISSQPSLCVAKGISSCLPCPRVLYFFLTITVWDYFHPTFHVYHISGLVSTSDAMYPIPTQIQYIENTAHP